MYSHYTEAYPWLSTLYPPESSACVQSLYGGLSLVIHTLPTRIQRLCTVTIRRPIPGYPHSTHQNPAPVYSHYTEAYPWLSTLYPPEASARVQSLYGGLSLVIQTLPTRIQRLCTVTIRRPIPGYPHSTHQNPAPVYSHYTEAYPWLSTLYPPESSACLQSLYGGLSLVIHTLPTRIQRLSTVTIRRPIPGYPHSTHQNPAPGYSHYTEAYPWLSTLYPPESSACVQSLYGGLSLVIHTLPTRIQRLCTVTIRRPIPGYPHSTHQKPAPVYSHYTEAYPWLSTLYPPESSACLQSLYGGLSLVIHTLPTRIQRPCTVTIRRPIPGYPHSTHQNPAPVYSHYTEAYPWLSTLYPPESSACVQSLYGGLSLVIHTLPTRIQRLCTVTIRRPIPGYPHSTHQNPAPVYSHYTEAYPWLSTLYPPESSARVQSLYGGLSTLCPFDRSMVNYRCCHGYCSFNQRRNII